MIYVATILNCLAKTLYFAADVLSTVAVIAEEKLGNPTVPPQVLFLVVLTVVALRCRYWLGIAAVFWGVYSIGCVGRALIRVINASGDFAEPLLDLFDLNAPFTR